MNELQENILKDFVDRLEKLDTEKIRSIYKEDFGTEDDYEDFGKTATREQLIEDLIGLRELGIEDITTQVGYDAAINWHQKLLVNQ